MFSRYSSFNNLLMSFNLDEIFEYNDEETGSFDSHDMNEEDEYLVGDEETDLILPASDNNKRRDASTRSGGKTSQPLIHLLTLHAEGRRILQLFKNQGALNNKDRHKLCNLIIRDLLGDNPCQTKVSNEQLLDVARQIKSIFPTENINTYIVPYKKSKKRCTSGKLYMCLVNRKREYRQAERSVRKDDKDVSLSRSALTSTAAETDEIFGNNDEETGSFDSHDMNEEDEYLVGDEETDLILPASDINKRRDASTRAGGKTSQHQPLMDLLTLHVEGRRILQLFKNQGALNNKDRHKLCNLIIRDLLGDNPCQKKVSNEQLLVVARQIKRIFPTEHISTYIVPYKKSKKRCTSGKLYMCLVNRKREYRQAERNVQKDDKDVSLNTSTLTLTSAQTGNLSKNFVELNNTSESYGTMETGNQKNLMNTEHMELPNSTASVLFPHLSSAKKLPQPVLFNILMRRPDGRTLYKLNKDKGVLDSNGRRKLCNIIVKDLLGDDPLNVRISSKTLLDLAHQIEKMFPEENVSTYYIPYTNNRQLNIKTCAKGKLYDCLVNRRSEYKTQLKHAKKALKDNKDNISTNILWLNDFSRPWELVEKKWKKTLEYRLSQLKDSLGVAQYMTQYPALRIPTGYRLLIQDFETLYPGYKDKLSESFPLYKGKIIEIALEKNKRTQDSTIKNILEGYKKQSLQESSNATEESTSIIAFLLLATVVGRSKIKIKESHLQPSKQESRERFIKYVATEKDLQGAIDTKTEEESQIGSSLQPSIFIVGPSITAIEQYFVVIDGTLYEVHSILQAVDVCFKMYTSLNCKYQPECENVWNFIQKGFYNIKNPWDKQYVGVNELLANLGIAFETTDL